jgi:uncharacterized protein (DUF362 family)
MVGDMAREMPVVAIVQATYRTAEAQIREVLRLLDYTPQLRQILLKPNLVTWAHWLPVGGIPRCVHTDIRFIEALLRVFDGYEIVIGEGSVGPGSTDEVFERTGVAALARRYGVKLANLDDADRVEVPWQYGTLRLPALLQTHEYINVPKLKTHVTTGVTIGCKNQKGLLRRADKVRFHRDLELNQAIHALAEAVQPALTIVDGIVGLEGPGPSTGRARHAQLVVAGRDMRAVDVACCDLIGIPPERRFHLDPVAYRTLGRTVEEARAPFDAPTETVVANMHLLATTGTCSRCTQSMYDGVVAMWRSPYRILRAAWRCGIRRTNIVIGKGQHALPDAPGRLVCYGDCTRELAQQHGLLWIPGCPPSVKESLKIY